MSVELPITPQNREACASDCACHTGSSVTRRDFILSATLASLALPAVAGPFQAAGNEDPIPADKKLRSDWLQSLTERGTPTVYRGKELATIGMPIGGLGCGQLYLGGDGRLWRWDLFNLPQPGNFSDTNGPNYAQPPKPDFPIEQGFALKVTVEGKSETRTLDSRGFAPEHIGFNGQYPVAFVNYNDSRLPVSVSLTAFSPFVPLETDDSSLPATVMRYTVKNTGEKEATVEIGGWLENAVCLASGKAGLGFRRNQIVQKSRYAFLHSTAVSQPEKVKGPKRRDIVFEDFENGYGKWKVEGDAFGKAPAAGTLANQQSVSGFLGKGMVNSFLNGDGTTGKLTSEPFRIERKNINFLVGGGEQAGKTCVNLVVNGAMVRTATGHNNERLDWETWDVRDLEGKQAHIEIVDDATGGWGHINVDHIVFSDELPAMRKLTEQEDFGSMGLALLDAGKACFGKTELTGDPMQSFFDESEKSPPVDAEQPFGKRLIGGIGRKFTLKPGEEREVTFLLTWRFSGLLRQAIGDLEGINILRRHYEKRFKDAEAVARYVATNYERLAGQTLLWNKTWYDSTLPYWFLDRTFATLCTLATNTCYRFDNGRFYAFEGVYCCQGTCQHVWNYAQGLARIFPALERDLRERTDFGTAWHEDGATDYRGECARHVAHDGQCGIILRAYREHQMSAASTFLRAKWARIRRSIEYLIGCDGDENGLIEGQQFNTLDAAWYGPMAWISSFYIAALRAGEAMAVEMDDREFAARCRQIAERGTKELLRQLYNGEYFIHRPDPAHPDTTNTNNGCHIDQLMGQAWALQVGLPRIVPKTETLSALNALWKYNFTPDVGPFRNRSKIRGGRWYAMAGEGGMVMTTFPRGGVEQATGKGAFGYYFNEVWTGQEHQVAAHYLWEGDVQKGLAVTRMVHDRHHAARRNPYNEVECSDHYTRAMSSYGTFLAACGYEAHGPKGHLGFAPRLSPEKFRAAFTSAEGWGTFAQERTGAEQKETIILHHGKLTLRSLAFELPKGAKASRAIVTLQGKPVAATFTGQEGRITLTLEKEQTLAQNQKLDVVIHYSE